MIDLYNGDCLEVMDELIADGIQVDLTVTSPPYDNLRTYNDSLNWNEDIWKNVLDRLFKITKDGGVVVWVVGDATIKGSETGTSFKQALYAKDIGFNLHDTMIYKKTKFSPYDPRNKRYKQQFEYMFILSKGKPNVYNPIRDVPNKYAGLKFKGRHGRTNKDKIRKPNIEYKTLKDFQDRSNIWDYAQEGNQSSHPAPFPKQLAQDHIISWSDKGNLILDCFMGSGTTGVACKNLNRSFIGIELDTNYFNIAKDRIYPKDKGLFD